MKKFIAGLAAFTVLLGSTGAVLPEGVLSQSVMTVHAGFDDDDETFGDFKGRLNGSNLTITGYNGSDTELSIPTKVDGYTITAIDEAAFRSYNFTKVSIPSTVSSIGSYAFQSCTSLETVVLPDTITVLPEGLFSGCIKLKSVKMPAKLKTIGKWAFSSCKALDQITIPSTVTTIGEEAFLDCTALKEIEIGKNVTNIGNYALGFTSGTNDAKTVISDFVINCYSGSKAAVYASNNKISYYLIDNPGHIHAYDSGVVTKEPTCQEMGVKTYTCSCGDSYTEPIAKVAHKYVDTVVAPTTTARGYTLHTCSVCGSSYKSDYTSMITEGTSISGATVTLSTTSFTYTGAAQQPKPVVTYSGKTLTLNTDYTLSYQNNVNVGTATVIVSGKGSYNNTKSATFKITAASLSGAAVSGINDSYTSTGAALTPVPTVTLNGKTLTVNTDYSLTYKNNTNAGTATITIKGKGNYTGTVTKTFTITNSSSTAVSISGATVTGINASYAYTGSAQTPAPTVTVNSKKLTANTDYTAAYKNNTNVGTATVTITGKGNYTGTVTKTFKITALSISGATVTGINTSYAYTGKALTPVPTVTLNSKKLISGTDYTIAYSNNTNKGTATITITAKGNYTGTVKKTFTITAESGAARTPGDATGDGKVNIADVIRIQQKLAGWKVTLNESNADVTGDGKVNISDVIRIQQKLAGWKVTLK